jgi:hypothetical protein
LQPWQSVEEGEAGFQVAVESTLLERGAALALAKALVKIQQARFYRVILRPPVFPEELHQFQPGAVGTILDSRVGTFAVERAATVVAWHLEGLSRLILDVMAG